MANANYDNWYIYTMEGAPEGKAGVLPVLRDLTADEAEDVRKALHECYGVHLFLASHDALAAESRPKLLAAAHAAKQAAAKMLRDPQCPFSRLSQAALDYAEAARQSRPAVELAEFRDTVQAVAETCGPAKAMKMVWGAMTTHAMPTGTSDATPAPADVSKPFPSGHAFLHDAPRNLSELLMALRCGAREPWQMDLARITIRKAPGGARIETVCLARGLDFTEENVQRLFAEIALVQGKLLSDFLPLSPEAAADCLGELPPGGNRGDKPEQPQGECPSITVDEANAVAMGLATQDAGFVDGGIRQWAARIQEKAGKKCTEWIVGQTRLWLTTMEATGRGRRKGNRQSRPKAVSLNESAAGKGERDEVLKRLAQEQAADFEPSPLDDDPPDEPRRVRHRKRV
jgi:hypothetical protein